jgi:hypothetical protein
MFMVKPMSKLDGMTDQWKDNGHPDQLDCDWMAWKTVGFPKQ